MRTTGIGVSLFVIAVGAILTYAINAEFSSIDISVVGVILMIAGGVGLVLSLLSELINQSRETQTTERRYDSDGRESVTRRQTRTQ